MFYSFKKIPVSINGKSFLADNIDISSEISTTPNYKYNNRFTEHQLISSPWVGELNLRYYLTGFDYLKQFIYTDERDNITGNIAGLSFNYGYLTKYSLDVEPNSPVYVDATITFFDQITGSITQSNPTNNTGFILRSSDLLINNLSNFTVTPVNNFLKASFLYSNSVKPSYLYNDTGAIPYKSDFVFFNERKIESTILSDNSNLNIPVSGENFGCNFVFQNPFNTGIYETIGCSGIISQKRFSISSDSYHTSEIKISQNHLNQNGYIFSVLTGANNFTINFNSGFFPLLSSDGSKTYLDKIYVGDTLITGYSINRTTAYDQIICPNQFNISNDILTVYTSAGNYIYPNIINFQYPSISISGISNNTGAIGSNVTISGSNFIRVSDVFFGGVKSSFIVKDPQTILSNIPQNGLSGPITVSSNSRNTSGSFNSFFFQPFIYSINPQTGQWLDTINLSGINFTGTTGVYFNNIQSPSFTVNSNQSISCVTPSVGAGFPSGIISVFSSGGLAQSYSYYNPVVPIYGFSSSSGFAGSNLAIYTKVDTGYLFPYSGGYLVNVCGVNSVFYLSGANYTGALTGSVPFNVDNSNPYIYIYSPDGISSYSSRNQFTVIGQPSIYYASPLVVNKYQVFNLLVVGNNLNYFYGLPYYVSITGGVSGDSHKFGLSNFNYSSNGQSLLLNNIQITGSTGSYDILVSNSAGTAYLYGEFTVLPPVNLASSLTASYTTNAPAGSLIYGFTSLSNTSNPAALAIDGSQYTTAVIPIVPTGKQLTPSPPIVTATGFTGSISFVTPSNKYINVSNISINPNFTGLYNGLTALGSGIIPPTGRVRIYQGNSVAYDSSYVNLSGFYYSTPVITGVTKVSICSISGYSPYTPIVNYIEINEVIIY